MATPTGAMHAPVHQDDQKHLLSDRTIMLIKPEEIAADRHKDILAFVEAYCKNNGLTCTSERRRFTKEQAERHFLGRGDDYIKKVGRKTIQTILERGFTPAGDEKVMGELMLKMHAKEYTGKDILLVTVTGPDALTLINRIKGSTDPTEAEPGTVRHQFSTGMTLFDSFEKQIPLRNIVHVPVDIEELSYDTQTFPPASFLRQ